MSNITTSFYALAKSNNGMFKSDKQASFLLSQCEHNVYFRVVADTFGDDAKKTNYSELTITCDSLGVVSIVKVGQKSGKTTVQFERNTQESFNYYGITYEGTLYDAQCCYRAYIEANEYSHSDELFRVFLADCWAEMA